MISRYYSFFSMFLRRYTKTIWVSWLLNITITVHIKPFYKVLFIFEQRMTVGRFLGYSDITWARACHYVSLISVDIGSFIVLSWLDAFTSKKHKSNICLVYSVLNLWPLLLNLFHFVQNILCWLERFPSNILADTRFLFLFIPYLFI